MGLAAQQWANAGDLWAGCNRAPGQYGVELADLPRPMLLQNWLHDGRWGWVVPHRQHGACVQTALKGA